MGTKNKTIMTNNIENVVRTNVLQWLKRHDVSYHQMALDLGYTPSHLGRIISGKRHLTLRHVEQFAQYLHIPVTELLSEPRVHFSCHENQHITIDLVIPQYDLFNRLRKLIESIHKL